MRIRWETKSAENLLRKQQWEREYYAKRKAAGINKNAIASTYQRNRQLKQKYGMTIEDFDALVAEQNGLCPICARDLTTTQRISPSVDHCHETGAVRGVLCGPCNSGIGSLQDSIEVLEAAIAYLGKPIKR